MRFLITLSLAALGTLSPLQASSGELKHGLHPIDNVPVHLEIDGISIDPGHHTAGALRNIPFTVAGNTGPYKVEVFYNGESRPDLIAESTLLMPSSGPFSGIYRLDVSDRDDRHYTFFIDRPLLLTTDVEPLLQNSNTSRMIIAGAPAGTGINIASDNSIRFLNAAGEPTSYVKAPDLPELFNATAVLVLSAELGTHNLHAFASNIPDSSIKVLTVSKRPVSIKVTDADGNAIKGAQITITDSRMEAWGLEDTYTTDQLGGVVLDLPAVMLKKTSSAVGFHITKALIAHDQNEVSITLANTPMPYLLSGALTSQGGDFGSEVPTVSITLSDATIVRIQPDKLVSSHFHFSWKSLISPTAKPKVLTILHSGHRTETIDLDTTATEEYKDVYLTPHNDPLHIDGVPDTAMIFAGVNVTIESPDSESTAAQAPAPTQTSQTSGLGSLPLWFILLCAAGLIRCRSLTQTHPKALHLVTQFH